jgi:UDP-N-acetyl-D-mannosaminuronic acid transferase (WecB/TagA/CpsF family)
LEAAMKRLRTKQQVVAVLGGLDGVCQITEANLKQAWHWIGRAEQFPANTYVAMQRALNRRGYEAPARLWNMKGLDKAA